MCLKLIGIVGILLQIIGVLLLARSDLLIKRADEAWERIPNNPFIEKYKAKMDDREPIITKEEQKYEELVSKISSFDSLLVYKQYLWLIILGMSFQLVEAIFS